MEFPYEKQAMEGGPIPPGLCRSDAWMFVMLRELYHQLATGAVNKEIAMADKRKFESEYNKRIGEDKFSDVCTKKSIELWKRIEMSANEFAKTKSLDSAERMYRVIYGLLPLQP